MTIETGWSPVALSTAIEPGMSTGAVLDGAEVVVWRDSKGAVHAWEDRCPHRGMRMSFGFVRGDQIACLYHGWQYDGSGQCSYIPAHPDLDVPKTIRMATYAVAERNGIVWTVLTENADAEPPADLPGTATPVRSVYIDCTMDEARAALADAVLPGGDAIERLEVVSPTAVLLASGDTRLLVACQSIGVGRIGLHLVLMDAPPGLAIAIAHWATVLRLQLETPHQLAEVG